MTVHDGVLPDGSPCWVECAYEEAHRGLHHAKDFYGRLFGWHIVDAPAEQGHYTICLKDDRPAAAITVAQDKNAPTVWTTYLASSDVDAAAQRVTAAGGTVLMGPQDVPGAGRAAFCADPSGGTFGIWQAGDFTGYGRSGEAGAIAAHTLLTRDLDGAKKFYAEVFGYRYVDETEFGVRVDLPEGSIPCNIHAASQLPDDVNASWLPHFGVAERDSSAQMAEELDGYILMSFETPAGREAIAQAKHGELFGLLEVDDA
ncbi:VOC family protein [Calidifontibacter indicus]|uniref:VOC domain-containing protein n=1 Tax=Calidifontibacter indicus TaxID=419650 RepID=A0A3D9UJW4_9MICO|nr:VOC family protein [Calidifontibacter indicus]REF29742.1 hypothetical protein DFJ65_0710 [Calidifontibacter indicus]